MLPQEPFIFRAAKNGNVLLVEAFLQHGANIEKAFDFIVSKYPRLIASYADTLNTSYSNKRKLSESNYGEAYLKIFDQDKAECLKSLTRYREEYEGTLKILLDCAVGKDLSHGYEGQGLKIVL